MSQRGPLTAIVTTVLGMALGGLLVWRVYRTKRKRASSFQKVASLLLDALPEVEGTAAERELSQQSDGGVKDGIPKAVACQSTVPHPAGWLPWSEQLLATKPQTVSSENEWLQLWPRLQEELSVFPILGFDCEWVKSNTLREKNTFFMLASYCSHQKKKNRLVPIRYQPKKRISHFIGFHRKSPM